VILLCPRCGDAYRASHRSCPNDGETLVPPAEIDPRLSSVIGNYRLVELLGKGGMGVVYRVEHVYMGTPAAIKILHDRHAGESEAIERFLQEARAAASIRHPNIVDCTDFGETADGLCYFVMEHIEGRPLDQLMEEEAPLPLIRAINIVNQIGRGVGAAHERGIVHRDLKPENVMVQKRSGRRRIVSTVWEDGEPQYRIGTETSYDFVKVLDFGVAKVHGSGLGPAHTTFSGHVVGTPDYMAPETVRGRPTDHRIDIYALGVMFYEMVTGCRPFDCATAVETMAAHAAQPVPSPRLRNPKAQVTEAAERLIQRAMAKSPDDRPDSMEAFLAELQDCYGDERFIRTLADQRPFSANDDGRPRRRSLTEDLKELFAQGAFDRMNEEPILLTKKKSVP
jgi:serine/threonine protein kinase